MTKKGRKQAPKIMISCKVNVQNFESVGVSVEGSSKSECLNILKDILNSLGKNEVTREMIQAYTNRVIGS